ncbi:Hypothetical protein TR210_672 [Trichococcus ilyis]|uniref:Uncharacterized protein n=1 Tax=Trichococcus ilyis TaxID=640938 RepID=A0A143YGY1_9LACT|nr:Hypothetical protein TR210_672 [Trichococcus ilyis]
MIQLLFQSTHSRGVRLAQLVILPLPVIISIHALTRSATTAGNSRTTQSKYFNPRTHEECDVSGGAVRKLSRQISIHALTRSATLARCVFFIDGTISIHALTRSATLDRFQSGPASDISIHALTRSATEQDSNVIMFLHISIHALTRSATKPAGVIPLPQNFNPRTHEECDWIERRAFVLELISIHALTRSATIGSKAHCRTVPISIHALTRSATNQRRICDHVSSDFNPRTHEECD